MIRNPRVICCQQLNTVQHAWSHAIWCFVEYWCYAGRLGYWEGGQRWGGTVPVRKVHLDGAIIIIKESFWPQCCKMDMLWGIEVPGFYLSNRFFVLIMSLFSWDGIPGEYFDKLTWMTFSKWSCCLSNRADAGPIFLCYILIKQPSHLKEVPYKKKFKNLSDKKILRIPRHIKPGIPEYPDVAHCFNNSNSDFVINPTVPWAPVSQIL